MHFKFHHLLVFAALALSSCAASSVEPSDLTSTDALIQALKGRGVTVTRAEAMPPSAYPFFSVAGQRLVVNDADVIAFEYASAAGANGDASRVSPTGTPIGQSQIAWMDTPHFYKRDRLIVLFVGHAADVMKALEAVLGQPFASGR